jgi:hypothetical protein
MNAVAQIVDIGPVETPVPEIEGEKALVVYKQAEILTITDKPSYEQGCASLLSIKDMQKKLDETFDPIIQAAHKAHRAAIDQKKKFAEPLAAAEKVLKNRIATFLEAEEEKRKAEEDRLRLIAEKAEEERRLQEAIQAEADGDLDEAAAILDDEPAFVPPPFVPKTVETGGGISMRKTWKFTIEDASKIPREYLTPDMVKIGGVVRALREAAKIPGVRIYAEDSIAAGRR